MTSSLVGSEMCIRDSCTRCAGARPPNGSLGCRLNSLCPGAGEYTVVSPVSYTHLTLPTICSV
eukprot:2473464-Prorocentrum_lima.AAC.1